LRFADDDCDRLIAGNRGGGLGKTKS
ncbi:unnamed protein product, partial [Rotaria magnacalcarata]